MQSVCWSEDISLVKRSNWRIQKQSKAKQSETKRNGNGSHSPLSLSSSRLHYLLAQQIRPCLASLFLSYS